MKLRFSELLKISTLVGFLKESLILINCRVLTLHNKGKTRARTSQFSYGCLTKMKLTVELYHLDVILD